MEVLKEMLDDRLMKAVGNDERLSPLARTILEYLIRKNGKLKGTNIDALAELMELKFDELFVALEELETWGYAFLNTNGRTTTVKINYKKALYCDIEREQRLKLKRYDSEHFDSALKTYTDKFGDVPTAVWEELCSIFIKYGPYYFNFGIGQAVWKGINNVSFIKKVIKNQIQWDNAKANDDVEAWQKVQEGSSD